MSSYLCAKFSFKGNKKEMMLLKLLAKVGKNIYNSTLYLLRQKYFTDHKLLTFKEIYQGLKENPNLGLLEKEMSYEIIKSAYIAMDNYIKTHNNDGSLKPYYKDKLEDKGLPKYKAKEGLMPLTIAKPLIENKRTTIPEGIQIRNGLCFKHTYDDELLNKFLKDYGYKDAPIIKLTIPKYINNKDIIIIRIVPKLNGKEFLIEYTYKDILPLKLKPNYNILGIDLGVDNLAACATNTYKSFIIDGRKLKSRINLYNKKLARAKDRLPLISGTNKQMPTSLYIKRMSLNLNRYIEAYLNKATKIILEYCKENEINEIVVGWNKGLKTGGIKNDDMYGFAKRKANQQFEFMPLSLFKDKLIEKSRKYGIAVKVIDESYTSKLSFYDGDSPSTIHPSGTRISRGLYRTSSGMLVNADINAALNIIRKYVGKSDGLYFKPSNRGLTVPGRIEVKL